MPTASSSATFEGKIFEYPEAKDGTPLVHAPKRIEEPELV